MFFINEVAGREYCEIIITWMILLNVERGLSF
jgi:hypothetical protein